MSKEAEAPARRISSIVYIVIIVVLALSLSILYNAYDTFVKTPDDTIIGYYLLFGFIGLALSTYMLFQTRRRMKRYSVKAPPVTTTIVCSKCEFKNVRNFERGDYILKKVGQCTKCEGTTTITAIYRELKEKGKEEKIFT